MNHGPKSNEKREYMFDPKTHNKYKELILTIPRRKGTWVVDLYQYESFWFNPYILPGILWAQDHFKPKHNDVILSSAPKSGTN